MMLRNHPSQIIRSKPPIPPRQTSPIQPQGDHQPHEDDGEPHVCAWTASRHGARDVAMAPEPRAMPQGPQDPHAREETFHGPQELAEVRAGDGSAAIAGCLPGDRVGVIPMSREVEPGLQQLEEPDQAEGFSPHRGHQQGDRHDPHGGRRIPGWLYWRGHSCCNRRPPSTSAFHLRPSPDNVNDSLLLLLGQGRVDRQAQDTFRRMVGVGQIGAASTTAGPGRAQSRKSEGRSTFAQRSDVP